MIPLRYGDNKPKFIRWAMYCVLLTVAVLLQNSVGGLLDFLGARVFLCIPLCVAVAMVEREVPAAIFGAFTGALWDVSSGVDGFNTIVLMSLGAICSLLISHLMRNNLITALVLGIGSITVYEIIYIFTRFWNAGNPLRPIFTFYFPSIVLTAVFIPICYFLIKYIYDSHRIAE